MGKEEKEREEGMEGKIEALVLKESMVTGKIGKESRIKDRIKIYRRTDGMKEGSMGGMLKKR